MTALSVFAAAREVPRRVALIIGAARYSYSDLAALAHDRAAALAQAPAPLLLRPLLDLDSLLWIYAASAVGTTFLPLHAGTTAGERAVAQALSGAQPMSVSPDHGSAQWLDRAVDPEKPYAFMLTSGSSGTSKIVILSRRAVLASALASECNLGVEDEDRWLLCLPLSHVGGLSILVRMLAARRTIVLLKPRVAGLLDRTSELHSQIREQRVTLISMVPTLLERLLQEGFESPAALRALLVGGAGCSAVLAERARRAGVPLLTSYGLTETSSHVVARRYAERYAPLENRGGCLSSGYPLRGVELRLVGGRIAIRGAALLSGYLGATTSALEDDWFLTNDRGFLGPDGQLYVLGRDDLLIVTGGENVDPEEVEQALRTLPEVLAACVCGVACAEFGQRVAAIVVTQPHCAPLSLEQLRVRLAVHLAPFKLPRELLNAAALPLSSLGKLDRRACTRLLEAAQLCSQEPVSAR